MLGSLPALYLFGALAVISSPTPPKKPPRPVQSKCVAIAKTPVKTDAVATGSRVKSCHPLT